MSNDPLLDAWRGLEVPSTAGELNGLPVPGHSGSDLRLAVDAARRWHLLVPAGDDEPIRIAALQGLELTLDTLRIDSEDPRRFHDLSCRDPAYNHNFVRLAGELIDELDGGTESGTALTSILRRWRRFWSNRPGELSHEDATGLFGELWFLERWLTPIDPITIETWYGPSGDRHDFRWPAASVEVKATRVQTDGPATHRISRLDQLAPPDTGQLHLFSLRLTPDPLAHHSLERSIARIRSGLDAQPDALLEFNIRLAQAGVGPGDEEQYDQTHRIVGEELYRVDADFPRLVPDSFPAGLPAGVDAISYSLDLSACQSWRLADAPGDEATRLRDSLTGLPGHADGADPNNEK